MGGRWSLSLYKQATSVHVFTHDFAKNTVDLARSEQPVWQSKPRGSLSFPLGPIKNLERRNDLQGRHHVIPPSSPIPAYPTPLPDDGFRQIAGNVQLNSFRRRVSPVPLSQRINPPSSTKSESKYAQDLRILHRKWGDGQGDWDLRAV